MKVVGTVVRGGTDYTEFDWCRRVAVVFGNEASGLDPAIEELLDETVSIPMAGRAESLNVSVSTAIVCFEVLRQRRAGRGGPPAVTADPLGRPTMPDMEGPGR